ncbi:hypothetical protein DVH05_011407 [Phytophthora capsici]|nr:hypothetical protein DVH05_011407 [Phytophthora capsici]
MPNATAWTKEEDVYLCKAYTNTSEDGATSTDQSSDLFWSRVHSAYQRLAGANSTQRKWGALQSRWAGSIRPDVALFASALASAKAERRSGWTDEEYIAEAEYRFTSKREQLNANALKSFEDGVSKAKRKPRVRVETFRFMHCYDILRSSVRFMREAVPPRKRQRSSLSAVEGDEGSQEQNASTTGISETTDSAMDSITGGGDDEFEPDLLFSPGPDNLSSASTLARPPSGKKKAKQLQYHEQVDRAMVHSQTELAKATTAQVEIMRQQLAIATKKVNLMEAQQKALKEQAEMTMMCTSVAGLSDEGKEFLAIKQRQLLHRLKNEGLDI